MTCGVYTITCGYKVYVGSSKDVEQRWSNHRSELRSGRHHCTHLQNAWNQYGVDAFTFEVFEECDPADRIALEEAAMRYFEAEGRTLYNCCPHPETLRDYVVSAETRARLSAAGKGRKMPESFVAMLRATKGIPTGRPMPESTRAALQATYLRSQTAEYKAEQSRRMTAWWAARKLVTLEVGGT